MTAPMNYPEEIVTMKKELEFLKKQVNEIESMIWALDDQYKEYYKLMNNQSSYDSMYLVICVVMNIVYVWWINF
jgi:hypothetical protein